MAEPGSHDRPGVALPWGKSPSRTLVIATSSRLVAGARCSARSSSSGWPGVRDRGNSSSPRQGRNTSLNSEPLDAELRARPSPGPRACRDRADAASSERRGSERGLGPSLPTRSRWWASGNVVVASGAFPLQHDAVPEAKEQQGHRPYSATAAPPRSARRRRSSSCSARRRATSNRSGWTSSARHGRSLSI